MQTPGEQEITEIADRLRAATHDDPIIDAGEALAKQVSANPELLSPLIDRAIRTGEKFAEVAIAQLFITMSTPEQELPE